MDADVGKGDALCRVCGDKASGKHYGVASCDGCRGFFKRSIRRNLDYVCKEAGRCVVDVTRRNQCQACRFSKCLQVNMKKDAVQHERAPRSHLPVDAYPSYHGPLRRHGVATPSYPLEAASAVGLFPHPAASYLHHQLVYQQGALKAGFAAPGLPLGFHLQFPTPTPTPTPTRPGAPPYRLPPTPKEDEVTSSEEARNFKDAVDKEEATATAPPQRLTSASTTAPLGWQYAFRPLDLTCLTLMPAENVYESAAKLLFLAVKWARSIPSFLQLTYRDQATLLEEAWSELFVLSAAQWALPVDEEMLVAGAVAPASRHSALEEDARRLRETVARFVMLRVDHTEYACLKALVLFKADARGVRDPGHVEVLQEQTHVMLHEYCASRHKARFGKLLLMLPAVHRPSRQSLEELFFKKTVGDVPIERLLGDMVKSTISH